MKRLTVGLLWQTLGHPNLGIDALTRSNIAIINAAAKRTGVHPEFVLLGTVGPYTPDIPDVVQGPAPRLKQLVLGSSGLPAAVRACDIVFDISEGDSFADIYGVKRFLVQSWSKALALRDKGVLVLSPQTVGPFNAKWTRTVAKHIIDRSAMTFPRDGLSTKALADLGVTAKTREVIDVAFRLPFERPAPVPGAPIKIGINVSGLLFASAHRFQMSIDYPAFVRETLSRLTATPGVEVWLTPHVIAEGLEDDDLVVSRQLQQDYPGAKLAPVFTSASQAKSFISGMDFFSGARMHACIGAYSSGVPVVPVAYSRKFNGLFQTLGYDAFIDGRQADDAAAMTILMDGLANRAALAVKIQAGLVEAEKRLTVYEDHIAQILSGMA